MTLTSAQVLGLVATTSSVMLELGPELGVQLELDLELPQRLPLGMQVCCP